MPHHHCYAHVCHTLFTQRLICRATHSVVVLKSARTVQVGLGQVFAEDKFTGTLPGLFHQLNSKALSLCKVTSFRKRKSCFIVAMQD